MRKWNETLSFIALMWFQEWSWTRHMYVSQHERSHYFETLPQHPLSEPDMSCEMNEGSQTGVWRINIFMLTSSKNLIKIKPRIASSKKKHTRGGNYILYYHDAHDSKFLSATHVAKFGAWHVTISWSVHQQHTIEQQLLIVFLVATRYDC
jgi:hypothetical protein